MTPDFMTRGLCAQTDPEAFYPGTGQPAAPAAAICRHCPVQAECLDYALTHDERFGVWGGTSPRQRAALRCGTARTQQPTEHPEAT